MSEISDPLLAALIAKRWTERGLIRYRNARRWPADKDSCLRLAKSAMAKARHYRRLALEDER